MTEFIQSILNYINVISGGNEFMAGAISAGLMGGLTYFGRDIPLKFWSFAKQQFSTSITINNTGYSGNQEIFNSFLNWYSNSRWLKFSRSLALESLEYQGKTSARSAGYGWHILFYQRRLYWFNKSTLDSAGSERQKEQVQLYTLGRNVKAFDEIIKEFQPKALATDELHLTLWDRNEWADRKVIPKRLENSVTLLNSIKSLLFKEMERFINNREWFLENGLPHKLGLILHGEAGTGKTSIIRMLASKYERPLYTLNLATMNDNTLVEAFSTVKKGSIIAIEDFEAVGATKDRVESADCEEERFSLLTVSGLLNALDGLVPLDNVVIIFTTNHLEKVDKAMYRKGRIDHVIEIGALGSIEVQEYLSRKFEGRTEHLKEVFPDIKGCDLQAVYMNNYNNYDKMLTDLRNGITI
jgi:SpoVK/Ycf46/Vps4 family AAA+-type ATPase